MVVLRDNGAPVDAAGKVSIDDGFWNATLEAPDATAEPWSTPSPAERMKPFVNPVVGEFLEKARRAGG